MWLKLILILIVIIFVLILVIKRFVYFSPTFEFVAPRHKFHDIYEGNLHAWYSPGEKDTVILFCHGNAGNLTHRQSKLLPFVEAGYPILIFDYNGFGHSSGIPNEEHCYSSACRFVNLLKNQGYKKIIPYGESLGASVAAYIAKMYRFPKVILESGLPSIRALLKSWNKILYFFIGIFFPEFDTVKYLKTYDGSALVLHSQDDDIIPYESTDELRNLSCVKHIQIYGSHNNPAIPWQNVMEFIEE